MNFKLINIKYLKNSQNAQKKKPNKLLCRQTQLAIAPANPTNDYADKPSQRLRQRTKPAIAPENPGGACSVDCMVL